MKHLSSGLTGVAIGLLLPASNEQSALGGLAWIALSPLIALDQLHPINCAAGVRYNRWNPAC